jgi:translation initiation factor 1
VLVKEAQQVSITVTPRKWGKPVTILRGVDWNEFDPIALKELLKFLKTKLACGGVHDKANNWIELQGDHKEALKKVLKSKGFKVEGVKSETTKTGKA